MIRKIKFILAIVVVSTINASELQLLLKQRAEIDREIFQQVKAMKSEKGLTVEEINGISSTIEHPTVEVPNLLYNYFLREYFFSDDKESRGSLRDLLVSIEKKHAQRSLIENVVMIDLNQVLSHQIDDTPLAISKLSNKRKIQFSNGIHDLLIRQSLYNMIEEPKLEEYFFERRD